MGKFEDRESGVSRKFLRELAKAVKIEGSMAEEYRKILEPYANKAAYRPYNEVHMTALELQAALAIADNSPDGAVIIGQCYGDVGYITQCQIEISTPKGWKPSGQIHLITDDTGDP